MKTISILDTDITSSNLGNEIIMQAVYGVMHELFFNDFLIKIQCQDDIGPLSRKYIKQSDLAFIGGSNLLTSQMNSYKQIGFSFYDSFKIQQMILLGVGWWQYQESPNTYTKFFLKNLLSQEIIHSVRDEYTKDKLNGLGLMNVLNTSCPSTWSLTEAHCKLIPSNRTDSVVFTITDYSLDLKSDIQFIELLTGTYENVFFWPQGLNDLNYFKNLAIKGKDTIQLIPPKLSAFDELLVNTDIDYIGTRLHGGIRAMQKKRRSLILAIDNRAEEISADLGLMICKRDSLCEIKSFINDESETSLRIPHQNINTWKAQF